MTTIVVVRAGKIFYDEVVVGPRGWKKKLRHTIGECFTACGHAECTVMEVGDVRWLLARKDGEALIKELTPKARRMRWRRR